MSSKKELLNLKRSLKGDGITQLPNDITAVNKDSLLSFFNNGNLMFADTEKNIFKTINEISNNLNEDIQIAELGVEDILSKGIVSIDSVLKDMISSFNNIVNRLVDFGYFIIIISVIPMTSIVVIFGIPAINKLSDIIIGLLGSAEFSVKL